MFVIVVAAMVSEAYFAIVGAANCAIVGAPLAAAAGLPIVTATLRLVHTRECSCDWA